MKEFLFVFRNDQNFRPAPSPEAAQAVTKKWMDWVGSIAAQNKLVDRGNRLEPEGRVVRPNKVVTDGPYTEVKEAVGGYTLVKAATIDEAAELANGCPILEMGGNVEVREIGVLPS